MIKKLLFRSRVRRQVAKANQAHSITGKKYFVIIFKGKPVCLSKQQIKFWIRTRKLAKGTKIQDIEQRALYITP